MKHFREPGICMIHYKNPFCLLIRIYGIHRILFHASKDIYFLKKQDYLLFLIHTQLFSTPFTTQYVRLNKNSATGTNSNI